MRAAAIIAEYNPFHSGHAYQIACARQNCDIVVAVMSGNAVQRGSFAVMPKTLRAQAAVAGGVDLVLELPLPWAMVSAERFAQGAVGVLNGLGAALELYFGAECDDVQKLDAIAQLLTAQNFVLPLKKHLKTGISFAAARQAALLELEPNGGHEHIIGSPNNILAIEYIKAVKKSGAPFTLNAVKRVGAAHDDILGGGALNGNLTAAQTRGVEGDDLGANTLGSGLFAVQARGVEGDNLGANTLNSGGTAGVYASASALRELIAQRAVKRLAPFVPPQCYSIYESAYNSGNYFVEGAEYEKAVLAKLRSMTAQQFKQIYGFAEGLENAFVKAAAASTTLAQFYTAVKSKRYALSAIRRLVLACFINLPAALPATPPYIRVLAANKAGAAFLGSCKKTATLPISHALKTLEQAGGDAAMVAGLEAAATALYTLFLKTPDAAGSEYMQKFKIL